MYGVSDTTLNQIHVAYAIAAEYCSERENTVSWLIISFDLSNMVFHFGFVQTFPRKVS